MSDDGAFAVDARQSRKFFKNMKMVPSVRADSNLKVCRPHTELHTAVVQATSAQEPSGGQVSERKEVLIDTTVDVYGEADDTTVDIHGEADEQSYFGWKLAGLAGQRRRSGALDAKLRRKIAKLKEELRSMGALQVRITLAGEGTELLQDTVVQLQDIVNTMRGNRDRRNQWPV